MWFLDHQWPKLTFYAWNNTWSSQIKLCPRDSVGTRTNYARGN
jgi:hypothetical protein